MKVFPLLLAAASVSALTTRELDVHEQVPLRFDEQANLDIEADAEYEFDWDRAPHPDATGHLIFNTVSSLLQRWPNTVVRPGHNIVPGIMPEGTIMYHGRGVADVPDHPDWLAFDFEHAYMFARSNTGHVLTFAAARPLKFLYFDGSSAAKVSDGSLDSQEVVMFHGVRGDKGRGNEHEKIEMLCNWGKPLGIDGFVRMEFHFEVMYCDFTDGGFKLVNSLNILPKTDGPGGPRGPRPPPGFPGGPLPDDDHSPEGIFPDFPPPDLDDDQHRHRRPLRPDGDRPHRHPEHPLETEEHPHQHHPHARPESVEPPRHAHCDEQGVDDEPRPRHRHMHDKDSKSERFDEPPRRSPPGGGPWGDGNNEPPKGWIGTLPRGSHDNARIAGKWHDYAPGETRVQLDYTGLITFYDPAVKSLVEARRGLTRPEHRLANVSRADADMKIQELEEVVSREKWGGASGVDWASLTRIVVERYGSRLEILNTTLASPRYNTTAKAANVRQQLLTMLVLYITRPDVEARLEQEDATSAAWLTPVFHRCATTQTSSIPLGLLTKQEELIHNAVGETLHEICRRVGRAFHVAFDIEQLPESEQITALAKIQSEIHELMAWLDWTAVWTKCRPACEWDEMCTVPTWPFGRDEDPEDMTPRCRKLTNV